VKKAESMSKFLVLFLVYLTSFAAFGVTFTVPDTERVVYVNGPIGSNALEVSDRLQELSVSRKPVTLVINSPGGSVFAGSFIVAALDLLKARKVPVACVVTTLAASMAFQLLPHCEKRVALAKSYLLFHPMRVNVPPNTALTADDARDIAADMDRSEDPMKREVQQMMCLDDKTFNAAYKREQLWTAEELVAASGCNWLTLVDDVEGIGPVIFTVPKERGGF
jgi:ATP-dependent protease ClpP protease subunit